MSVVIMKMLIIMLFFALIETLHLSPKQMYSARGLLMNPALTVAQRQSIQNLLYVSHEKWAVKKATEFKQLHRHKCRDISTEDLVLSSKIGLLKSSKKYDGRAAFNRYAEIYVKSELLRTLTIRLSITNSISTRDRLKSKTSTNATRVMEILDCMFKVPSESPTPLANTQQNEFYRNSWTYVDSLDVFTKRVIWTKYDYEFKVQYSNKQIAELMCCSEETVRKAITRFSDGMRQEVLCTYASV